MAEPAPLSLFPDLLYPGPPPLPANPRSPLPLPEDKRHNEYTSPSAGQTHLNTDHTEERGQIADFGAHNVQQRYALVRDTLLVVVDQNGKSAIIARHHIVRSKGGKRDDYDFALKFILKLLKGGEGEAALEDFVRHHPKLRLQACFEDLPIQGHAHAGFSHYIDIDPNSWSEVASLADRIAIAY